MVVDLVRPYAGFATAFDAAVRALDLTDQEAFIAIDIRGLTTYEAAAVLGLSQPTVSRSATRARLNLKERLT